VSHARQRPSFGLSVGALKRVSNEYAPILATRLFEFSCRYDDSFVYRSPGTPITAVLPDPAYVRCLAC
jgi:hypothetical protein